MIMCIQAEVKDPPSVILCLSMIKALGSAVLLTENCLVPSFPPSNDIAS